mmetsp:Transcript_102591/g.293849  ORF Transcript_102591/g.293849 Transcript_102591/m.293849 type:complete len:143 (-) Transcript_102591:311-739(-)
MKECLSNSTKVLEDMAVHVTKFPESVKVPPLAEMKAIVQAAGGTWVAKLPSEPAAKLLVISCKEAVEKDKGLGTKVRKLIAGGVSGGFIATTTCLFDAVMRKELRFDGEGHVVPDASLGAPPAPGGSTSATSSGSRSRKRGR